METMYTLMRKDWRVYRAPVIGTVVLGVGPYLLYGLMAMTMLPPNNGWRLTTLAATASLACLAVVASAFGGMAWAAERAERTATFTALLPPTRLQQSASKLAVATAWLIPCFLLDAGVGLASTALGGSARFHSAMPADFPTVAVNIATFGIAAFGIAWASSSVLNSSAISAAIGLVTCVMSAVVIGVLPVSGVTHQLIWFVTSLALGVTAVVAGTAVQRCRVAP